MNFSKVLLKFAIVFKIFEYFCPFLSSTIITGQRSFSSVADGLVDITPETKVVLDKFLLRNLEASLLIFAIFCKFLSIRFLFDLFTNKASKLKVEESNQAKANLAEPWLATNEATRLPPVLETYTYGEKVGS